MRSHSCFACTLLVAVAVSGQSASAGGALQGNNATANNMATSSGQPVGASDTGPLGDYVPCIFSENDERSMRAQTPEQKPLDPAQAQFLLDKVNYAIQNELATPDLGRDFAEAFQEKYSADITSRTLTGITPDAAVARIQSALSSAIQSAKNKASVTVSAANASPQQLQEAQNAVSNRLMADVGQAFNTLQSEKAKAKSHPTIYEAVDSAAAAITKAAATPDQELSKPYLNDVLARFRDYVTYYLARSSSDEWPSILAHGVLTATQKAQEYPYQQLPEAVKETVQDNLAKDLYAAASDVTKQAGASVPARQFQPPNDVSCSTAVLSWKETHDIFGGRVANTFVAIQVTLRNLNTKNEFLIHDIQVAVDTGVDPDYFGRFQAGRDKLLVRAVAQVGQTNDPRNVTINALQAVGAIAGASSVTAGTAEFRDAVAVFQSAFLPGLANIFPDHTVEQLNHINDLVFSASSTSKVVVPVQGSVPLVTFISERPLEELPFAWCGSNISKWFHKSKRQNCNFNGGSHDPGYPDTVLENSQPWDSLKYKAWSGAALRMLQMHTFVVVGGVHIQQVETQPKIGNLTCSTLPSGQVDLSQTKDGLVSCSATGSGLSLVSGITLLKGSSSIPGKIQPAADGNSATIAFNPEELCDKQGGYSLMLTYKSSAQANSTDLDSGESALLGKQPTIS